MELRIKIDFVKEHNDEIVSEIKRFKGVEMAHTVFDVYKVTEYSFQQLREKYDGFDLRDAHLNLDGYEFNILDLQLPALTGGHNMTVKELLSQI